MKRDGGAMERGAVAQEARWQKREGGKPASSNSWPPMIINAKMRIKLLVKMGRKGNPPDG